MFEDTKAHDCVEVVVWEGKAMRDIGMKETGWLVPRLAPPPAEPGQVHAAGIKAVLDQDADAATHTASCVEDPSCAGLPKPRPDVVGSDTWTALVHHPGVVKSDVVRRSIGVNAEDQEALVADTVLALARKASQCEFTGRFSYAQGTTTNWAHEFSAKFGESCGGQRWDGSRLEHERRVATSRRGDGVLAW